MENKIKVFENDGFGSVRIVEINNEPWFVAKDVSDILGYAQTSNMVKRIDSDDFISSILDGMNMKSILINESGLYSAIMGSKLPTAKQFKHWITSEVLPTIRKTGGYIVNSELMITTYFGNLPIEQQTLVKGLFDNIIAQQAKINTLTATNEVLTADILSWADRPLVNALVRRYAGYACDGNFAIAWTDFKKELLYKYSININSRITAHLNKTGKKTKPKTLEMITDDEVLLALKTIVSLCENSKIDISDLLNKHKEVA